MKNNKLSEVRYLAADADSIEHNLENDGVDRRGFLKCMAWAGTGMLWTVSGGVLASRILSPADAAAAETPPPDTSFTEFRRNISWQQKTSFLARTHALAWSKA